MKTVNINALVSVIIPAYNCEKYIEKAICSVLDQTVKNIEIIVIDDCSTDNTWKVITTIAESDSRVHIYKNQKNLGVVETRNRAMSLCHGTFIALLDGDDFWYENKLECQLKLQAETKADLVYCSYAIVDENDRKQCKDFIVPDYTNLEMTLEQSVISCSTAMFRRGIADKYCFKKNYYHEDLVFWIDILKDGAVARGTKEILAAYRMLPNSRASNKLNSAVNRYKIMHGYLGYSICDSLKIIAGFAVKALDKYKRTCI